MTTGKVNGRLIKLFMRPLDTYGSAGSRVEVGCSETISLNISVNMLSAVCRDDGDWEESTPGTKNWSGSVSGFIKYDNPFNVEEIFDAIDNATAFDVEITTDLPGDLVLYGKANIENFSQEAAIDTFATYSFDFKGTGPLAKTTAGA